MSNSFSLIKKYAAEKLDEKFIREAVTGLLLLNQNDLNFTNAKTVMVPEMTVDGLGDYDRVNGYASGSASIEYIAQTLKRDRSQHFNVDVMDNEETAGNAYGKLQAYFMKHNVIPENDAYILSTVAKARGTNVAGTISANKIIEAFNTANKALTDKEVPETGRICFISTEVDLLIKNSTELQRRITQTDLTSGDGNITLKVRKYDDMILIVVPIARFKSDYTFETGKGETPKFGFTPTATATDINFMIVHEDSVIPVFKHQAIKVVSPDANQKYDGYSFYYRAYGDVFVNKNMADGIYVHSKVAIAQAPTYTAVASYTNADAIAPASEDAGA